MINKWIGIGNVCAEVDTKYSQSGTAIANFTVACGEKYKDKSGNMQEQTEFVRVVAFARLGEVCSEFLAKGSKVYIEGRMQTRSWEDKDGNKRYTTEIVASTMKMLSGKNTGGQPQAHEDPPAGDGEVPF